MRCFLLQTLWQSVGIKNQAKELTFGQCREPRAGNASSFSITILSQLLLLSRIYVSEHSPKSCRNCPGSSNDLAGKLVERLCLHGDPQALP